jgi:hypothetical protein
MDNKGFIFTMDAALALVVMIVLTASVVTYGLLPIFQGENHQHLQTLADSVLETMDQNGALREAAVEYAYNGTNSDAEHLQAQDTLNTSLSTLIPSNIGYRLYVGDNEVSNNNGVLTDTDVATSIKVISGPQEGWMGRAYYKQDQVLFQNINTTDVTTLWNFHNYLKNFIPWQTNGLNGDKFWGGTNVNSNVAVPIVFSMPGTVNSAQMLLGSAFGSSTINGNTTYNADVVINNNNNYIKNTSFTYLYNSSAQGPIYNYLQNINTSTLINNAANNFYIKFNATNTHNMPWFTILGNYSTSIPVPQGISNTTTYFPNLAGIGSDKSITSFNLATGTVSRTNTAKVFSWTTVNSTDFDNSTPFELTNIPNVNSGSSGVGSAVATVQDLYYPPGNRLFDAFTVVNAFGGEDGAVVQVKPAISNQWITVFSSFNPTVGNAYTARSDGGYGNVPGIINIQPYLQQGHNEVRIITWDDSNGGDFDLVGLQSCYSTITFSGLPIRWDTFPFNSYQNSTMSNYQKITTETQVEPFHIDQDAGNAFLFIGAGSDTRNITVTVKNSTGGSSVLYKPPSPIPYVLNLGDLDSNLTQIMTTNVQPGVTYQLKPGNYTVTVSVTPSLAYESGSGSSSPPTYGYTGDPILFSGTRLAIVYPKFLDNVWATGYANDPQTAANNAVTALLTDLTSKGITNINMSLVRNSTIYTGDVPSAIPVRLELYEQ